MFSLHSPNGQWGCLTIEVGQSLNARFSFAIAIGFVPSLWGLDIVIGDRMWSFPRSQQF